MMLKIFECHSCKELFTQFEVRAAMVRGDGYRLHTDRDGTNPCDAFLCKPCRLKVRMEESDDAADAGHGG